MTEISKPALQPLGQLTTANFDSSIAGGNRSKTPSFFSLELSDDDKPWWEEGNQPQVNQPLKEFLSDEFSFDDDSFVSPSDQCIDPLSGKSNTSLLNPPLPSVTTSSAVAEDNPWWWADQSQVDQPLESLCDELSSDDDPFMPQCIDPLSGKSNTSLLKPPLPSPVSSSTFFRRLTISKTGLDGSNTLSNLPTLTK